MDQSKTVIAIILGLIFAGGVLVFIQLKDSQEPSVNVQSIVSASAPSAEEANEYFSAQDWENSASAYAEITQVEPENNQAWFRLGLSLQRLDRYSDAVPAYEAALEHGFFNIQVMISLARVYSLMNQPDMAISWLRQATDAGLGAVQLLNNDPDFANARTSSDFQEILAAADQNARPCEFDERYRQWDFWIGEWDVFGPGGQQAGTNRIEKISNGCALLENWVGGGGSPGHSINYFDASIGKWRQYWVSSDGGTIPQEGEFRDGAMHTEGRNYSADGQSYELFRGTWTPLEDGRVRQFLEQSRDEGETWYTWFDGYYVRKEESAESNQTEVDSVDLEDTSDTTESEQVSNCTSAESRQFDFWVGEWDLAWDESPGFPASTGTNIINLKLADCVIEENFSAPDWGYFGQSVSTYDANNKVWKQTWVDSSGGYLDFVGGLEADGRMMLSREFTDQNGQLIMQRMIFSDFQPTTMEWNWERSEDGGQTWNVVWNIHYSRRQ
jgi:tetratricopeptide (TPR) repeat protein